MSRLLYKFASRSRPDKFFAAVDNIYLNSRNKNFLILASLDTDDVTMNNASVRDRMVHYDKLVPIFGSSKNKVDAINRDLTPGWVFDILICMSDDMAFIEDGFDLIIEKDMHEHFPDLDGVLHYPDQNQGNNCMTMSIMGKKYYEYDGFIYNPKLKSLWVDIIAQEQAQIRKRYKFIDKRILNHYHPSFGCVPYDDQYRKTEAWEVRQHDYNVYLELKKEYDPENIFPVRSI